MENDIGLSGVNPAHWPEIRRRVAILDEFVKIKRAPREVAPYAPARALQGRTCQDWRHRARRPDPAACGPGHLSRHPYDLLARHLSNDRHHRSRTIEGFAYHPLGRLPE